MLRLQGLTRRYGNVTALDGVSLDIPAGSVTALLGPSGSGKSTLLRLAAGLEQPDGGTISLDGEDLIGVPPQKRGFGMVFQDYALFPHLDVNANIAFGLVEHGWPPERRNSRVAELLELTGLHGLGRRRMHQLSGGQQQRVALARALAIRPRVLLLDEPLSNLDQNLRLELRRELAQLFAGLDVTVILVTHDQEEAFSLASRVALLRAGRLEQAGPADTFQQTPETSWTARFLGYRNILTGSVPGRPGTWLLRDERVRLLPGSTATVQSVSGDSRQLDVRILPDGWSHPFSWQGRPREVPVDIRAEARVALDIPEEAWLELS